MRRHLFWSVGVFVVTGAYAGCSDSGDGSPGGTYGGSTAGGVGAEGGVSGTGAGVAGVNGAGGSAGAGAGSSGASGATGASGAAGASGALGVGGSVPRDGSFPDVVFTYDARPEDTGVQGDGCASVTARAEASPLDMYIILDNSGSMHEPRRQGEGDCNIGETVDSKWCRAINALNGFFNAPSSVGMGVALQYFNIGGDNCAAKATPAVALQNLPSHVGALSTSLNNTNPDGSTPTLSAADGIVQYTRPNQRPGRRMIGIIITDGDPQGCSNNNPTSVNASIAMHYQQTGIPTFIVGMDGAAFNNLNTMGQNASPRSHANYCGGGPNPCWYYSVGNGDPTAFVDALREIQQSAIGCVYNMPRSDGGVVDPARVRVTYSAGGNPPAQTVEPRASSMDCGNGWYYDNPTRPTTIHLCPNTCNAVKTDTAARIDVIVGCQGS